MLTTGRVCIFKRKLVFASINSVRKILCSNETNCSMSVLINYTYLSPQVFHNLQSELSVISFYWTLNTIFPSIVGHCKASFGIHKLIGPHSGLTWSRYCEQMVSQTNDSKGTSLNSYHPHFATSKCKSCLFSEFCTPLWPFISNSLLKAGLTNTSQMPARESPKHFLTSWIPTNRRGFKSTCNAWGWQTLKHKDTHPNAHPL